MIRFESIKSYWPGNLSNLLGVINYTDAGRSEATSSVQLIPKYPSDCYTKGNDEAIPNLLTLNSNVPGPVLNLKWSFSFIFTEVVDAIHTAHLLDFHMFCV